jgi:predicted transcriptional regulator
MIDTKRIPFTTTLNKDLIKKLKLLAVERETAVNMLIEEAVNQYLEKPTKKPK